LGPGRNDGQCDLVAAEVAARAMKSHHAAEIDKWWPIVKAANIKAARQSVSPSLSSHLKTDRSFRHGRARPGHPRLSCLVRKRTWMPGTRPGMTNNKARFCCMLFEPRSEEYRESDASRRMKPPNLKTL
jgi:hypothetical protein